MKKRTTPRPPKPCTHERVSLKVEYISGKDVAGGSLARATTTCTTCGEMIDRVERHGISLDALLLEVGR